MEASKATNAIRERIELLLNERFEQELEFGPIVVMPRVADDGIMYVQSYIVFHGDQDRLDPRWTLRLSDALWGLSQDLGYPGIPIQFFVERSEWPELEEMLA